MEDINKPENNQNQGVNSGLEPIETKPQKPKKSIWRRFKNFFLFLVFLTVILGVSGIVLAKVYEKEVIALITKELDKRLTAEVRVKGVELSFFKHFPLASVNFKEVKIIHDIQDVVDADTLIKADNFALAFSVLDVINKKYSVKKISAENGLLNILFDKKGKENYIFWKQDSLTSSSSNFSFELDELRLKDFDIEYYQLAKKQQLSVKANDITFSGEFTSEIFDMRTKSELFIHSYFIEGKEYISSRNCIADVDIKVNKSEKLYQVNSGKIELEELTFDLSGSFQELPNAYKSDVSLKGKNIDLIVLGSLLPDTYRRKLDQYETEGVLDISANIYGTFNPSSSPNVKAEFSLINGSLTESETDATIEHIYFKGNFNSAKNNTLKIDSLGFKLGDGNVFATGEIKNDSRAIVKLKSRAELPLKELHRFLNLEELEELSGDLIYKLEIDGGLRDLTDISLSDINKLHKSGEIELKGLNYLSNSNNLNLKDAELIIDVNQNKINIEKSFGHFNNSPFQLKAKIYNLLPYFVLEDQNLKILGDFRLGKLNLDAFQNGKEESDNAGDTLHLPENVLANFNLRVDTLISGSFSANYISTAVAVWPSEFKVNNLKGSTSGGNFISNISLKETSDGYKIYSNSLLKDIDLTQLFSSFENFDQDYIKDENLEGKTNAEVKFSANLSPTLVINENSIDCNADFEVIDGALIEMPLVDETIDYLAESKVTKSILDIDYLREETDKIKFNRLHNTIRISKGMIEIPIIHIESSLMDLNLSGKYYLDSRIDFRLDFRLTEIADEPKKSDFGYIVDDGTGIRIFMRIFGTTDDPEFSLDKEKRKEFKKERRKEEIKKIKSALKEEFGWFKKDSTLTANQTEKQQEAKIIIQWEEEEEKQEEENHLEKSKAEEERRKRQEEKEKALIKKLKLEDKQPLEKKKSTIVFEE